MHHTIPRSIKLRTQSRFLLAIDMIRLLHPRHIIPSRIFTSARASRALASTQSDAIPSNTGADAKIIGFARRILQDNVSVLNTLSDTQYTTKVPEIFNASIGEHMRHSLDHFEAVSSLLLGCIPSYLYMIKRSLLPHRFW